MSVPKFDEFMLPILRVLSDGQSRHWRDLRDACVEDFKLSDEDQAETVASGSGTKVDDRVQWANAYLFQAGLVDRPRRGTVQITERGRKLLEQPPTAITVDYLRQYQEFREFLARRRQPSGEPGTGDVDGAAPGGDSSSQVTPLERIEAAAEEIAADLHGELLRRVVAQPPEFLEQLVLKLLVAMGYGAKRGDIQHRGGPGDGGIDGVIKQDPLGLDMVYIQAKRYADQAVGRQDVQAFVGALRGAQADRGVFITTSRFTANAVDFADRIPDRIILIDGQRLVELMVRHNVGVQVEQTIDLKQLDEDFFE